MIEFRQKGDFSNLLNFFKNSEKAMRYEFLHKYGQRGVDALSSATPKDSGITASSWFYVVKTTKNTSSISFHNSNIQNGVSIAIILHYGHGTRNGGYVQGRQYISPAIQPIFDVIADEAWKEVTMR